MFLPLVYPKQFNLSGRVSVAVRLAFKGIDPWGAVIPQDPRTTPRGFTCLPL
jgi:hypothetical protein